MDICLLKVKAFLLQNKNGGIIMKKNIDKSYRIPIMRKNILKNLSLSNIQEGKSIWETILIGRISATEDAYHNIICKLIETAYKNIINGKIKFDNIDNFDKSRVKKSIYNKGYFTECSILYEIDPDTDIRIIEIIYIDIDVFDNQYASFYSDYEQWELAKYKDRFFLIAKDEDKEFFDIYNRILADFDASIPIKKIIMQSVKLIAPRISD